MTEEILEGFELSRQQKHLWLSQQDSDAFVSSCELLIEGALDREVFAKALRELIARHEILRTSFRALSGMSVPVQVISEKVDGPNLLGVNLSTDTRTLTITQPSLIGDAESLIQLVMKLARYYTTILADEEVSDEPVQYVDFSEWQHELWDSEDADTRKEYWRQQVAGANSTSRLILPLEQTPAHDTNSFAPRAV
ncbi:MAG TPA: condensation domain-containing protein, partial [Pyrinomonadaceae bacterium]|nr:condensation domain-containing protein [Pyrinomonadaceae bacterium]